MEVKKEFCAQIGVPGMSDSLTYTTPSAIMRQCQQDTVGYRDGKGPAKTVSGHA